MTPKNGFTLVELLVAISIVAVLATIGLVTYRNVTNSAKDVKRQANVRAMAAAYEANLDPNTRVYRDLIDADFASGEIPSGLEYHHYTDDTSAIACSTLEQTGSNYCVFSQFGPPLPTPMPFNFSTGVRPPSPTPMPTPTSLPTPTSFLPTPTSSLPTPTSILPTPTSSLPTPTSSGATPTPTVTPIPTNVALHKTAVSSADENASLGPSYAVDGDKTVSRWGSFEGADPQWIYVDLGNYYTISSVKLYWQTAYGRDYQIQVSNDASTWTTIYTKTGGIGGVETLNVSGSGRYVRMYGTARGTIWGYSLFEFEIYGTGPISTPTPTSSVLRDPLAQPFASTSIWNMPIGSGAVYVPANLNPNPGNVTGDPWTPGLPSIDDEVIVMEPTSPLTDVNVSSVGWSGGDRCPATGGLLTRVNMPSNFTVPNSGKNSSATFLNSDNRTLQQLQPLARCTAGGYATALNALPTTDIYGDGLGEGSHGGSGLSAFGGSIRMGELRPGQTGMRHALKVNVFAKEALYDCADRNGQLTPGNTTDDCYRWPARWADGYAAGWYGTFNNLSNTNAAMKMGALLAIPATTNISSLGLESEPGRQIAWTLQNYGAYIVDDTWGEAFSFNAEKGPDGSKRTEFASDWGMPFESFGAPNTAWERDVQRIISALSVVNNNSLNNIGGGGTRLQPLAPDILGANIVSQAENNTSWNQNILNIIMLLLLPSPLVLFF